MAERDLLQQAVNEIRTREDYRSVCFLVQQRIRAGAELDAGLLTSLAVKGMTLSTDALASSFLSTWRANPGDNGSKTQWGEPS